MLQKTLQSRMFYSSLGGIRLLGFVSIVLLAPLFTACQSTYDAVKITKSGFDQSNVEVDGSATLPLTNTAPFAIDVCEGKQQNCLVSDVSPYSATLQDTNASVRLTAPGLSLKVGETVNLGFTAGNSEQRYTITLKTLDGTKLAESDLQVVVKAENNDSESVGGDSSSDDTSSSTNDNNSNNNNSSTSSSSNSNDEEEEDNSSSSNDNSSSSSSSSDDDGGE